MADERYTHNCLYLIRWQLNIYLLHVLNKGVGGWVPTHAHLGLERAGESVTGVFDSDAAQRASDDSPEDILHGLPEVNIEDEIEHEVAGKVDGLEHVSDFHHSHPGRWVVFSGGTLRHEAEDLRGGYEHDVHDDDGDEYRGDTVVGVHVGGWDAVATSEPTGFPQGPHEADVTKRQHG